MSTNQAWVAGWDTKESDVYYLISYRNGTFLEGAGGGRFASRRVARVALRKRGFIPLSRWVE